ncbi:cell division protein ZapA [Candidatus Dependentiae bacterium]|nr:cell division protein ZapA [Candidatus Dependentiae bacterium]
MQKQLKITLNGKQYSIATDEHDQDILQAAKLVDTLFKAKNEKMPTLSEDKIALMVALHIATDLVKSQRLLADDEMRLGHIVSLMADAA